MTIDALGFAGNAGIYVIVSTPIYLAVASRGLRESGSWDRAGIREAIPSLFLFSIAGITIFLAIGLGPIAIVVPLTTAYPIVAILVRRWWMGERATLPHKVSIGLAMVGAFLATLCFGQPFESWSSPAPGFRPCRACPVLPCPH